MYHGTDNGFVEGLELGLLAEDDIRGELHLHQAPMVAGAEALMYGAKLPGPQIQPSVKLFGVQPVGKPLSSPQIGNG